MERTHYAYFTGNYVKWLCMNVAIFWDTVPCSPYVNGGFGGTYRLHLQGLATCYTLVSCSTDFRPSIGMWWVPSHPDYTVLYPRRWQHSQLPLWERQILQDTVYVQLGSSAYVSQFVSKSPAKGGGTQLQRPIMKSLCSQIDPLWSTAISNDNIPVYVALYKPHNNAHLRTNTQTEYIQDFTEWIVDILIT
jgi:hypothetical protein